MKGLSRTDLHISEKVYLAAASVAMQGTYGAMSELAEDFELSRPTLYALGHESTQVLEQHFEASLPEPGVLWVRVDRRQLERATIALRCRIPSSVPALTELMPTLYPGIKISYGAMHAVVAEAEQRAAAFNATVELNQIEASALDEMFSQGQPILSGIDLESGLVSQLRLATGRSAADWKEVLGTAQKLGFSPQIVVKDAARGIAAAVSELWPQAEQRDDCFHAAYEMGKVHCRLERTAYAAIEYEEHLKRQLHIEREKGRDTRGTAQKLRRATVRADKAIGVFDSFEQAQRAALEALEAVDIRTMTLRSPAQMQHELLCCAGAMLKLPDKGCRKVGRYLKNRTPGLVLYDAELSEALETLPTEAEPWQVCQAAVLWQAAELLHQRRQRWAREAQLSALRQAWNELTSALTLSRIVALLEQIQQLWARRYRASSAVEGLHAALRPHLYVHKSVSQGFLDLFRAYVNLRHRRSGRHKGSSAYELLTGQSVEDWLSVLGYPPTSNHLQN